MNVRGDTHYPNPQGNLQSYETDYSGIPVQYLGYPPRSHPQEDQYHYGLKNSPPHIFTDVSYPHHVYQDSSIKPCRAMQRDDTYQLSQYNGCLPGQTLLSRQSSSTKLIRPTKESCTGVGCQHEGGRSRATEKYHYPQRTKPYTLPFPRPVLSPSKAATSHCQQVLQSDTRRFPTSQPVASHLKRLTSNCDPNPIPLKRQWTDHNSIPHSVQLSSYQRSLNIQGNCYPTVAEDTNLHQQIYRTAPPVELDKLREMHHGQEQTCCQNDISGEQTYLPMSSSRRGNSKACNEVIKELTARRVLFYVSKVFQLVSKYMPHLQPTLDKMATARCIFLTNETCSQLMSLIRKKKEKYVLACYIKYRSQIYNMIKNSTWTQNLKENELRSSKKECLANSSVKQNTKGPLSNIDNTNSISTSSHLVSNSCKDICVFPGSSVPMESSGTFSPSYSHSSHVSSSFLSSPNSFARVVDDLSSSNSACTFLSESEYRDKPNCENVKQQLHAIENMIPPAVENILPHPRVTYSRYAPNYDKLHLNPSSENYNYPTEDAHSVLSKKNPYLKILTHQPETPSYLSCNISPSLSQFAMGDVNLKQHAASLMKLPKAVSSQHTRNGFSSKRISSNITKFPDLSLFPTKLPTVHPFEDTSRSRVTKDNSPMNPAPKSIQPPKQSPCQKFGFDVSTTRLPTVYPISGTKFLKDNYLVASKPNVITSEEESFDWKTDAGISSSNLPHLATGEAKVPTDNCAETPQPNSVSYQEESLIGTPESICSKSNESNKTNINCFKGQPSNILSRKQSQESTVMSDMIGSSVKDNFGNLSVNTSHTQNTSEGLPGISSSLKEECITIDDSDDEIDAITLDDETEDSTATKSLPNISSGFRVSGTTFATFTIEDDELEMTTQEFGIETLDMFAKSELQI